jgi:ubiquitin-protein ligase
MNKIFHPNIDELQVTFIVPQKPGTHIFPIRSGSVCLDVINQTWSPMFGKKRDEYSVDAFLTSHTPRHD